ncbi:MAG: 50S ribosomal protein L9 [Fimbriimonadia bacterium]|nr:50S ribosomal protein L9 [Fimbriimonadia bacterium]
MKVILTRDVPKVGKEGQLIEVQGGYARNYLMPRGLAVPADKGNLKILSERQKVVQQRADNIKQNARAAAAQLHGKSIALMGKTAANSTKLFGSITAADIANAIMDQHKVRVDKRRINLFDPLRTTGHYALEVEWDAETKANISVMIRSESAPDEDFSNMPAQPVVPVAAAAVSEPAPAADSSETTEAETEEVSAEESSNESESTE